jgi:hypothetical protein
MNKSPLQIIVADFDSDLPVLWIRVRYFCHIRIRNSRVSDPGPYPKMDVNISKNHQKKKSFHNFDHFNIRNLHRYRYSLISTRYRYVLKCHLKTFKILFLQEKCRIRNRIRDFSESWIQNFIKKVGSGSVIKSFGSTTL